MSSWTPLPLASYMHSSHPPHTHRDADIDTHTAGKLKKKKKKQRVAADHQPDAFDDDATAAIPPPSKKRRSIPSSVVDVPLSRLVEKRRVYIEELRRCLPFKVEYREQQRSRLASRKHPHQTVSVWVVGLNVDSAAYTLKRTRGVSVYMTYTPNKHNSYTHYDHTSCSAVCTFLFHIHTGDITSQQLISFFTNNQQTLQTFIQRFTLVSGLDKLIYTNQHHQHGVLLDLFTRGVRTKKIDDIPTRLSKMLKPKKDTEVQEIMKKEATIDVLDEDEEEEEDSSEKEEEDRTEEVEDEEEQEEQTGKSSSARRSSSVKSTTLSASPSVTPFSVFSHIIVWWSSSTLSVSSSSSSPYSSRVSHSQMHALTQALMKQYPSVGAWEMTGEDVDVELVLTRMDIRIIAALAAPTIQATSQSAQITEIMSYIQHQQQQQLQPSSSLTRHHAAHPAAIPLRLEDACLVIVERQYFERTVYPLIATPASMYELTDNSPIIEYKESASTQQTSTDANTSDSPASNGHSSAVKVEPVDDSTSTSTKRQKRRYKSTKEEVDLSSPALPDSSSSSSSSSSSYAALEKQQHAESVELVALFIRRFCSPSSFLLYSLQPTITSTFFAPVLSKSLWSVPPLTGLLRPSVVEWPLHLPFEPALIINWCQFHITVSSLSNNKRPAAKHTTTSSNTTTSNGSSSSSGSSSSTSSSTSASDALDILLIVPCRCCRITRVSELRQRFDHAIAMGISHPHHGGTSSTAANGVNEVVVGVVMISARPTMPSHPQARITVLGDADYLVISLRVYASNSTLRASTASTAVVPYRSPSESSTSAAVAAAMPVPSAGPLNATLAERNMAGDASPPSLQPPSRSPSLPRLQPDSPRDNHQETSPVQTRSRSQHRQEQELQQQQPAPDTTVSTNVHNNADSEHNQSNVSKSKREFPPAPNDTSSSTIVSSSSSSSFSAPLSSTSLVLLQPRESSSASPYRSGSASTLQPVLHSGAKAQSYYQHPQSLLPSLRSRHHTPLSSLELYATAYTRAMSSRSYHSQQHQQRRLQTSPNSTGWTTHSLSQ